jgi:uncharacterized MAPEG superfamily protein
VRTVPVLVATWSPDLTPELTALALAALIQYGTLLWFGALAKGQGTLGYQMGNRDRPPPHEGQAARAQRAFANHTENLVLFAIAVVVVTLSGQATWLTALCAWLYLAARILYVPAYVLGIARARSALWGTGWLATLLMLLAALF